MDLRAAIANDEALQLHFADFDLQSAVLRVLDHDEHAYVSYRKNGQILWTKTTVLLHKGELVLDDGTRLVRARCGNRIAYVPQFATESPDLGGKLDPPVVWPEPPTETLTLEVLPLPPTRIYIPPASPPPTPSPCCGFPIVPPIYIPPGGGSPPSFPVGPPVRAPEPPTALIFAGVAVGCALLRKLRRLRPAASRHNRP